MEEWKRIEGSKNCYISSEGRIQIAGKIRRGTTKGGHGYLKIYVPGVGLEYIHRLVLKAFKPQPIGKNFANHINGNKRDNRVENLEWSTNRENILLAAKEGKFSGHKSKTPVMAIMPDGTEKGFKSQSEAARNLGIKVTNINKCLSGDRKTTHGIRFYFCNIEDVKTEQMDIWEYLESASA